MNLNGKGLPFENIVKLYKILPFPFRLQTQMLTRAVRAHTIFEHAGPQKHFFARLRVRRSCIAIAFRKHVLTYVLSQNCTDSQLVTQADSQRSFILKLSSLITLNKRCVNWFSLKDKRHYAMNPCSLTSVTRF